MMMSGVDHECGDVGSMFSCIIIVGMQVEERMQPLGVTARRENISVVVRCRPLPLSDPSPLAWTLHPSENLILVNPEAASLPAMRRFVTEQESVRGHNHFDTVFAAEASTRQVYKAAVQRIVLTSLDGINGAVLAYGQTGSGKTFTMLGDHMAVGIITMALVDTFTEAARRAPETLIRMHASLLEIYNERVTDLFASAGDPADGTRQREVVILVRTMCWHRR
jgi:hypothetical protein